MKICENIMKYLSRTIDPGMNNSRSIIYKVGRETSNALYIKFVDYYRAINDEITNRKI